MNITLEVLRDIAILEKVITTVEAAHGAKPGEKIADIHGCRIAGKKITITLTAE